MTSTTTPPSAPSPRKRIPLVLITNIFVALFMLAALPIIYKGQRGFAPHAEVNKGFVNSAISSGEADYMNQALKSTEIARAMAYGDHLSTMNIMQYAVGTLAILFFLNSFYLFRLHRQPQPVQVPHSS